MPVPYVNVSPSRWVTELGRETISLLVPTVILRALEADPWAASSVQVAVKLVVVVGLTSIVAPVCPLDQETVLPIGQPTADRLTGSPEQTDSLDAPIIGAGKLTKVTDTDPGSLTQPLVLTHRAVNKVVWVTGTTMDAPEAEPDGHSHWVIPLQPLAVKVTLLLEEIVEGVADTDVGLATSLM